MNKKIVKQVISVVFIIILCSGQVVAKTEKEDDNNYQWSQREIAFTGEQFESNSQLIKELFIPRIEAYKGDLSNSQSLAKCLKEYSEGLTLLDYMSVTTGLYLDSHMGDETMYKLSNQVAKLREVYYAKTSFIVEELMAMDSEEYQKLLKSKELEPYLNFIEIHKPLGDEELSARSHAYEKIIKDCKETHSHLLKQVEVNMDQGAYYDLLDYGGLEERKEAYLQRYKAYDEYCDQFANNYRTYIKTKIKQDPIKEPVNPFVETYYKGMEPLIKKNLSTLHRYYNMRKQFSGLPELHGYDVYQPLFNYSYGAIDIKDSLGMLEKALQPLGKTYFQDFTKGLGTGWVDLYPRDGKYKGSYQWSYYGGHPCVLLNYDYSFNDTLKLAHHMGYAMNSHYSGEQNYYNYYADNMVRDTYAYVNDFLLLRSRQEEAKTPEEKLFYLQKEWEMLRVCIFVSSLYLDFEQEAVQGILDRGSVQMADLNELWLAELKMYYGNGYTVDQEVGIGWALDGRFNDSQGRIEQMMSTTLASYMVQELLENELNQEVYMECLSLGSSVSVDEVYNKLGIDIEDKTVLQQVLLRMDTLIESMEDLLTLIHE